MKTTDNKTYYSRHKPLKFKFIDKFISEKLSDIKSVYDVGCNNGEMSYPLQSKYKINVKGIDLSRDLKIPEDYDFNVVDIVKDNSIYLNDCTIFLSLYHHILGAYGLKVADDVFYKLLLRTKYLIFDTGNLSEKNRSNTYWYKEQSKHFKNEIELFDHFNIEYDIIGNWGVAGGSRSVVVFYSNSFNENVIEKNKFRRLKGSLNQHHGLVNLKNENVDDKMINKSDCFYQLEINNKQFFSKKHQSSDVEKSEINNIVQVYNDLDEKKLIKFYGFSKKYGIIYEWLDNFKYENKVKLKLNNKTLNDVDVIVVDGIKKYIDFER